MIAAGRELGERILDLLEATGVEVEMIGVEVRDDPRPWRDQQEGPIALVGFEHEQVAGAVPGPAAALVEIPADQLGRIEPSRLQRGRDE